MQRNNIILDYASCLAIFLRKYLFGKKDIKKTADSLIYQPL